MNPSSSYKITLRYTPHFLPYKSKHPHPFEHKIDCPSPSAIMSYSTYTDSSRKYYTETPKIIQSRGSSSDSRSSYNSRGSNDQRQYTSSRTSMGYYGGSQSKVVDEPKERRYRDPTAGTYISITRTRHIVTNRPVDQKYVESTSRGHVEVINQRKRTYDTEAPRSSEATSSHYQETQRHSSSRHSHKSSHRR